MRIKQENMMINNINRKIRNIFDRRKFEGNESGSALIFAIVLTIVVTSIIALVVSVALNGIQKTSDVSKISYYEAAAQTAISDAILVANSTNGTQRLRETLGETNSVTGVMNSAYSDQGLKWSWYTERISGASATSKYYVYATGYRVSPDEPLARTLRVTISSIANAKGVYDAGLNTIVYKPSPDAISQWGVMGSSKATMNDGALIKSYISDNGFTPTASTNQGSVASNGNIALNGTAVSVNMLNVLNYNTGTPNRCVGNATECAATPQNKITYQTDLTEVTKMVKAKCPNNAITYPVWKASTSGGVLNPGCYNVVVFDTDTSISSFYNETNPALVYVKGDVYVNAGVEVNLGRNPLALRIFSEGGSDATFKQGTITNPTKIYGVIISSTLACTDGTTTASPAASNLLVFYGGLVCDDVNLGNGTTFWWDELSGELTQNGNVNRMWFSTKVEELY